MGFTSWATSMTATPVSHTWAMRAATLAWLGRSRLSRGSSSSRSSGPVTSACAMSRRCCSPPDTWPMGRWAYAEAPTRSMTSSTRAASARARRAAGPVPRRRVGRGRPKRWPSRPKRTTSTPRMRRPGSKLRRWGRYPMRWLAWPGSTPSTSARPAARGSRPSTTRINVDLPTPLGPSTATNWPGATVTSTWRQMLRPPTTAWAPRNETTAGSTGSGALIGRGPEPGRRPARAAAPPASPGRSDRPGSGSR